MITAPKEDGLPKERYQNTVCFQKIYKPLRTKRERPASGFGLVIVSLEVRLSLKFIKHQKTNS